MTRSSIVIPNPLYKWREYRRNNRKVTLTRNQAMFISAHLECFRLGKDVSDKLEVRLLEDILDTQVWGAEYVKNRNEMYDNRTVGEW